MTLGTQAFLAAAPIALAGVLLVGFRIPAKWAMPAVYVAAVAVAAGAWQMAWGRVAAASIQGLFLTFDLLFIIFGALLLLNTLERSGGVAAIRQSFGPSATTGGSRSSCWDGSSGRSSRGPAGSGPRRRCARPSWWPWGSRRRRPS
jgi:hypothetical protein